MPRIGKAIIVQSLWMFVLTASWAVAQVQTPSITAVSPNMQAGAAVMFAGKSLFTVYDTVGSFDPQERALAIAGRLSRLTADSQALPASIVVIEGERTSDIIRSSSWV